jgi:hypothetical protein
MPTVHASPSVLHHFAPACAACAAKNSNWVASKLAM